MSLAILHVCKFYVINVVGVPGDSTKNQVAVKSMHRPRAIPQKLNGNNASNNSSPNTPRFAGSPFTSLEADAELPDVMSEQAAPTAAIKSVFSYLKNTLFSVKYTIHSIHTES